MTEQKALILVVDDEPMLRRMLAVILRRENYSVLETDNGAQGIKMNRAHHPDLILLDVHLPDINGFEVCRRIREEQNTHRPCILMLSGMHRKSEDQVAGLDIGADGYIVRPIPNIELVARIKAMIRLKQAEDKNRRLEKELAQAKQFESLATMSGGIAHDYNNLLMIIMCGVSLINDEMPREASLVETMDGVREACGKARALTNKFLILSQCLSPTPHDISTMDLISLAMRPVNQLFSIGIKTDFPMDLPQVRVDTDQVSQALRAILFNAAEAQKGKGVIHITAKAVETKNAPPLNEILGHVNSCVELRISDNGPGIAPEVMPKLFDPYFTTKSMGVNKGQGLGLAVARSYILLNGGEIHVDSEPGVGTTVTVLLPDTRMQTNQKQDQHMCPPQQKSENNGMNIQVSRD